MTFQSCRGTFRVVYEVQDEFWEWNEFDGEALVSGSCRVIVVFMYERYPQRITDINI